MIFIDNIEIYSVFSVAWVRGYPIIVMNLVKTKGYSSSSKFIFKRTREV
jgi:hypothetical protein